MGNHNPSAKIACSKMAINYLLIEKKQNYRYSCIFEHSNRYNVYFFEALCYRRIDEAVKQVVELK
jgi:hypothetical protein